MKKVFFIFMAAITLICFSSCTGSKIGGTCVCVTTLTRNGEVAATNEQSIPDADSSTCSKMNSTNKTTIGESTTVTTVKCTMK